jgi:uncharacterized protein (TIGR02117 family)
MGEGKSKRRRSRPRRRRKVSVAGRLLTILLAISALYMAAALIGSLVPVNGGWSEPDEGITIYLADNGIHTDIVMPARAQGLDWAPFVPKDDTAAAPAAAQWVAFGSGEQKVYLETPTWWDITPATIWAALTGSRRVMHVEWVADPSYADRELRLRPEEYRRLWAALRSDLELGADGRPVRVDHPGYGCCDAFYWAGGRFSAFNTCNTWAASMLRLAGVEASIWPPFTNGLLWRYRRTGQST